jgi:hypothetical protein
MRQRFIVPFLAFTMLIFAALACDIDQNFGNLMVNGTPQPFTPAVAENHTWTASVSPNMKYEVIISIQANNPDLKGINRLWVSDTSTGKNRYAFVEGAITSAKSLNATFVAPADGKILILFIPDEGRTICTIQLKQIQP